MFTKIFQKLLTQNGTRQVYIILLALASTRILQSLLERWQSCDSTALWLNKDLTRYAEGLANVLKNRDNEKY